MSEGNQKPDPEELLRLNRSLDAQLRQLVKAEQRLYLSQRDRARQIARLDALNRFALEATQLALPSEVVARAADAIFSVFPFDQFLGFLDDGRLRCVAARAVAGRESSEAVALDSIVLGGEQPEGPLIGTAAENPGVVACFARVFTSETPEHPDAPILIVPLASKGSRPLGLLAFRRTDRVISFHEELPSDKDVAFFSVFAQQVAAIVSNAQLVHDLKLSVQELARTQASLVDRERLAALGEFAAVIAHEVRNPLGVVFNVLSMLRKLLEPGEAASLVDILGEEAERLNQIVSDLIDFARPHPPKLARSSLQRLVASAVDSVQSTFPTKRVELLEPTVSLPEIQVDARMIRQALVNLLVNAMQASPEGASVTVRIATENDHLCIEIADRGDGIPQPLIARIFEPFFTTKATGTGLGLSVVKRVVEAHRGHLELASVPGEGSTFTVRLPTSRPTA